MLDFNAYPELQKWFSIANILGIDETLISNFMISFTEDGGFPAFRANAPDAATALSHLDNHALCLRIVELTGEQQAWLKARLQRDIEAGQNNGSRLNQVRALIDLPTQLDGLLARFAREQQAQATMQRENGEAKALLLDLLSAQLQDQERVETATGLIDAALLSLANDQERATWLTAKTTDICQEKPYLVYHALGLSLNQAECLEAVNDKITARIPEEQQQAARDCLTVTVAAKPAAEQLGYLLAIYREEPAFAEFLTAVADRARQSTDYDRRVSTNLRFARRITDLNTIGAIKNALQAAAPLDIAARLALFNEYDNATPAPAEFTLAGLQAFLESKKPKVVEQPKAEKSRTVRSTVTHTKGSEVVSVPVGTAVSEKTVVEQAVPEKPLRRSTRQALPKTVPEKKANVNKREKPEKSTASQDNALPTSVTLTPAYKATGKRKAAANPVPAAATELSEGTRWIDIQKARKKALGKK